MNPLLDAALQYREAGLHPIPIQPGGKRPAIASWKEFQDRMPTVEEIEGWWALIPDANIALIMGRGAFAVDVDGPEGALYLAAAGVDVSTAPCSRTARGSHYFFAGTAPDRIGLFPKVDIRGVGYVVAPPSCHESGHVYSWERPIDGALPPMPAALEAALRRPLVSALNQSGPDWFTAALVGVAEGGRDATCTRLAGYLLGKGLAQDAVEIILQAWAERCLPPFPADQVSKCVSSIAQREGAPEGPPRPIAEAIDIAMAEITAPPELRHKPASTSLHSLDSVLAGGIYPGEYIILGARPSVGKTALALQMARTLAKRGTGVLIASAEMTVTALMRRMLSQESQVNAEHLKTGKLIDMELAMLALAAKTLRVLPIWATSEIRTTDQLVATVATYTPGVLGLIVLDYLQLIGVARDTRDSRQRVEAVSKDLRRLAVQTEIPILALSSLSRPDKSSPNWEPSLQSLRESGELEHDGDVVFLMSRPPGRPETKLDVAKNRDGQTGAVSILFDAKTLSFRDGK